jgi:hypothetical protein
MILPWRGGIGPWNVRNCSVKCVAKVQGRRPLRLSIRFSMKGGKGPKSSPSGSRGRGKGEKVLDWVEDEDLPCNASA